MLQAKSAFSGFSVKDLAAAKQFYAEVLGLKLANEEMGLTLQLPSGSQVFIYNKDDHVPAAYTVLNFVVEDINVAVDSLVASGVTMEVYSNMPAPQDQKGILRGLAANQGPDIAWFKDPAGNVLSVMQDS